MKPDGAQAGVWLEAMIARGGARPESPEATTPLLFEGLAEHIERTAIGDLDKAMTWSEPLVSIADGCGMGRCRVRRARAQALAYANRFDEAQRTLREAISIAGDSAQPLEAAHCRLMLLHTLARQGRFDEAVEMGEASRLAFLEAQSPFHAARADINLGVVLRMKDDPRGALARFDRAEEGVRDHAMIRAQLQSNRAEALLDLHRFQEARQAFDEALVHFTASNATRAAAIVEGNIADLCGRQGRLDEALEHFERARRTFDQAHAPGDAARLEVERAETLLQLGLTNESRIAFESAAALLQSLGMAFESARAVFGLGRVLAAQGHLAQAATSLDRASRELEALGHASGASRVRLLRARVAMSMGDLSLAQSLIEGVDGGRELKPMERAELSITKAQLESLTGRHEVAAETILRAIEIARTAGLPVLLAQSLMAGAKVSEQASDPAGAMRRLAEAMTTIERIRSSLRAESFRAALSGSFSDAYDDYVRLWLDSNGDARHAIETVERGRARALLDVIGAGSWLSDAAPPDSADASLLARRTELCGLIAASHAGLHSGFAPSPARGKSLDAGELERQLAEVERRLAATRRFSGEFSPAPDGATIVGSVPAGGCLIEYFTEGDRISAIVVREGRVIAHRSLCTQSWLADSLGSLRLHLSIASSRGLQVDETLLTNAVNAFSRLGDALLGPMLAELRASSQLAIVADGHVASTPFQSLKVGDDWLIDLVDVIRVPSAGVLEQLRRRESTERREEAPTVVIGLADQRAPLAEAECRTVAELTGADRVLLGAGATRHATMAALKGAGRVHIATHARFVAHSPMQSAIKLADGWLTARDLHAAELAGGCVMLSACDSGRSGVSHGRELLGLGRALLAAGAQSLILSQWLLHDATASRIVSEVYGNARGASHASRSLRDAQRSERTRVPHPAAWGGLYVVGPWASSEKAGPSRGGVP